MILLKPATVPHKSTLLVRYGLTQDWESPQPVNYE
jgi:hypothetical protein